MGRRAVPPPGDLALAVSGEIRAELGRQNVSVRTLAERLETSATYVQERVNNSRTFSLDDVERISLVLGLPPKELLARAVRTLAGTPTPDLDDVEASPVGGSGPAAEDGGVVPFPVAAIVAPEPTSTDGL